MPIINCFLVSDLKLNTLIVFFLLSLDEFCFQRDSEEHLEPWTFWMNVLRHIQSLNNTTLNTPQKAGQRVTRFCSRKQELMQNTWGRPPSPLCVMHGGTMREAGEEAERFISTFTEQMEVHPYRCDPVTVRQNITASMLLDRDGTLRAVFWWQSARCHAPLLNWGPFLPTSGLTPAKTSSTRGHALWVWVQKLEGNDLCNYFLLTAANGVCSKRFRDVHGVGSFPPYDLGNGTKILLSTREQGNITHSA